MLGKDLRSRLETRIERLRLLAYAAPRERRIMYQDIICELEDVLDADYNSEPDTTPKKG